MEGRIAKTCGISWLDARDLLTEAKIDAKKDATQTMNDDTLFLLAMDVWNAKPEEVQKELKEKQSAALKKRQELEEAEAAKKKNVGTLITDGEMAAAAATAACCCCCTIQ